MFKRFLAVLIARNYEFFRDRAALGWNLIFPVLLVVGFAFIFSGDGKTLYKIGILNDFKQASQNQALMQLKHIEFVSYTEEPLAMIKLRQHKIDLLVDFNKQYYWINESSSSGYIAEKLLLAAHKNFQRQVIEGREIRYLDWVVPGILGMNMMFSCLFGVGYVIVRYRKNSVLKRLHATPLKAIEFLSAQICSRLFIVMSLSMAIFLACNWLFNFYILGSLFDLFIIALLGTISLISLGLLIASRSESEEFTGGMLNVASWPMMMLSGVWFSLEGSPEFIQAIAQLIPLTHMLEAARAIMLDGATLWQIKSHIIALLVMTFIFLTSGALLFRWQGQAR
ncbi:ABC transporter permease [Pseudoalteromonas denitrificans]|uniref:Transport permease protein n=1 Tax=Pseudoalteromonas denitrificans DSM 6059 TaxID=1123010 RepID=A0A1I1L9M6_9GAMM|nr:ABC transporter permease [Pseudoalteromonas denitrificans]SFC69665.1 ABC-type multidrug transport system, permease component [Pseudoalteromonas denitrificans DSM 6059]